LKGNAAAANLAFSARATDLIRWSGPNENLPDGNMRGAAVWVGFDLRHDRESLQDRANFFEELAIGGIAIEDPN
jgi:hypothetical protein